MAVRAKRYKNPNGGVDIIDYEAGYSASYPDIVFSLTLLGADREQVAEALGIGHDTVHRWTKLHPEFGDAFRLGKLQADAKVVRSLYQRAIGYTAQDVDVRAVNGEVVITRYEREIVPDVTACIFWLKNRQSELWRDRSFAEYKRPEGTDEEPTATALEAARRIAFALTRAGEALEKAEREPKELTDGRSG